MKTRSGRDRMAGANEIQPAPMPKRAKVESNSSLGSSTNTTPEHHSPTTTSAALSKIVDKDELSYYLFKSEPEPREERGVDVSFSINDLERRQNQTEPWDGVRNYEARNTMQHMRIGDLGFFYHSNCKKQRPGIVGIVRVVREAYPDASSWDRYDPHYDPQSSPESPRWFRVDVQLVRKFKRCVTLDEIKSHPDLNDMQLVKRGRISVQHVRKAEWDIVVHLADSDASSVDRSKSN